MRGRWLTLGAITGPVLFALAWIVLGVLQPPVRTAYGVLGGMSGAISNPISGLGVGAHAQLFNAAFVISGLMMLGGVVGVFRTITSDGRVAARWSCAVLLALSPLGLALAGIFTLASSILLHNVAALLAFVTPVSGFLAAGLHLHHVPGWRRFGSTLVVASPLTLLLIILFVSTFNVTTVAAGFGVAGLTERILLVEIHTWYVALAWLAFRRVAPQLPTRTDVVISADGTAIAYRTVGQGPRSAPCPGSACRGK
jgi:hypothetical membrane protein